MKTYKVPVTYTSFGFVYVDAENDQDLLTKLQNSEFIDELPLPQEPEYVDNSFEIDFDSLNEFYLKD